jgi:Xaa-Pro aminopeptidase
MTTRRPRPPRRAKPQPPENIPPTEYAERRARVLEALNGSAALVFAGDAEHSIAGKWRPDRHFLYLTGIEGEPGACVLFNPASEDPKRKICLFLRPLNPEMERWDGYRETISTKLKAQYGFDSIFRTIALPTFLAAAARRCRKLACLHPFAGHTANVSPDLAVFRKVTERVVGVGIEDRTMLVPEMRAVKSAAELGLMRRAADATAAGYREALRVLRPGVPEGEVQRALERGYFGFGAEAHAYEPIVGSGLNATVLHYKDNTGVCKGGEVLLIDSGAQYRGYACDVTRCFPVSGRFTKEQGDVYELVLKAQSAAIRAAKPGAMMWEVDKAARDVIDAAGYADAYIHGIGHHLGLDVHDAAPDGPLAPGMVITIEPGIYLPDQKLGVRIEDDILITKNGNENLTSMIPKSIDAVERAMAEARR